MATLNHIISCLKRAFFISICQHVLESDYKRIDSHVCQNFLQEFKANITSVAKKMHAAEKKAALANAKFLRHITQTSIQALSV
jgi:hypothetical protein